MCILHTQEGNDNNIMFLPQFISSSCGLAFRYLVITMLTLVYCSYYVFCIVLVMCVLERIITCALECYRSAHECTGLGREMICAMGRYMCTVQARKGGRVRVVVWLDTPYE